MENVNVFLKPLQKFGADTIQEFEPFSLIPATNNDFDFAYQLKKIAYREYIEQTWGWDEAFQVNFHKENFSIENVKIIKVGNQRIGTVDVKEDDNRIFISGLYLFPGFQNKGIGSSILKDLQRKAEAAGKRVELEVLRVNTKAQQLYQRLGFTMEERDETKFLLYKDYGVLKHDE